MQILKFDDTSGIYLTELKTLDAGPHHHPATEIIFSKRGSFSLSVKKTEYSGLNFAIICSNLEHSVSFADSDIMVLMVEHRDHFIKSYFLHHGIAMNKGFSVFKDWQDELLIQNLLTQITSQKIPSAYDPRIQHVIDYLNQNPLDYFDLLDVLKKVTHLSKSRLTHLFKTNTGISLKRYLVWTKLKKAIHHHLFDQKTLMDGFLSSGFYDQPHFNHAYRSFIGTKPVKTYKSRIVQDFQSDLE